MLLQRPKRAILVTIWPALQTKSIKIAKMSHPWNCHLTGLMKGKKKLHFVQSGQSYGVSNSKVSKNNAKVPNFNADLGVGSRFGSLCGQKRLESNFFSPEP